MADTSALSTTTPVRRTAPRGLLLQIVLLLLVAALILPPLAVLGFGAFSDGPPGAPFVFSTANVEDVLTNPNLLESLRNSLIFSVTTATIVTVLGAFIAWVIERTDSRFANAAQLFSVVPILIPAVTLVSAWIMLLSPRSGLINLAWVALTGSQAPLFDIYSFGGMVWVAVLQELPLAVLWLWPAFRAMNPDLEEAARMSGASTGMVIRRVTLPVLFPALLGAWMIFFVYAMGALSVPVLLGIPARIFLYASEIYIATSRVPTQFGLASLYSFLFLGLTALAIFAYYRLVGDASRFATIRGKGFRPRRLNLGRWRLVIDTAIVSLMILIAGLPIAVLLWNSVMPFPQVPTVQSFSRFTLSNFGAAWNYGPAARAVWNSLWMGAVAGILTTGLGALIAWFRLRSDDRFRLVALTEQVAMAPIAMPGMIVGVGLLWFWLTIPLGVYGSPLILLIAYVVLHLPYAVRIAASGLVQLHAELDEAGAVAGAGPAMIAWRIVLPLIAPALVSSAVYVSLRSFREYSASLFLTSPGTEVFSVVVLDMWQGGNSNILAAYTVMVMAFLAVVITLSNMLTARIGVRASGD